MGNNYTKLIGSPGEYQYQSEINPEYAQDKFLRFIIGRNGVAGCDFNFAAPANNTQQNLAIGPVLKANFVPRLITVTCTIAVLVGGAVAFNMSVGSTSGGVQYVAAGSCNTLNQVVQSVVIPVIDFTQVNSIFLGGVPTANNWSTLTAGQWLLTIFYEDFNV